MHTSTHLKHKEELTKRLKVSESVYQEYMVEHKKKYDVLFKVCLVHGVRMYSAHVKSSSKQHCLPGSMPSRSGSRRMWRGGELSEETSELQQGIYIKHCY